MNPIQSGVSNFTTLLTTPAQQTPTAKPTSVHYNAMALTIATQMLRPYVEQFSNIKNRRKTNLGKVGGSSTPDSNSSYLNVTSVANPADTGNQEQKGI